MEENNNTPGLPQIPEENTQPFEIPSRVHEHNTRVANMPESEKEETRKSLKDKSIPLMVRKFMAFDINPVDPAKFASEPYVENYYFFYGTLMDQSMLTRILGLDHEPELRPAYIIDHKMKIWGTLSGCFRRGCGG